MKECPRCGSSLSAYSLSDVEAYGCDSCGWVGVPVDHQSEPKRLESWQDAIQRFQQKFAADGLDEHAERLERIEQARRDAVNGDVEEEPEPDDERADVEGADDSAAEAGESESAETASGETDEPADASDDAAEDADDEAVEETEVADDEAVESEAGDGAEADSNTEGDEAQGDGTEAEEDVEDDAEDAPAGDGTHEETDEEVEVAADGSGQ
ncbi:zf-TFIIB domain-containing protein [Haloarchaeobius salinus]|uniref:TFIIB-type zinc ribbon-containing protein n=1 Tax=Haloarchaeobius salinus TaxID=1198298 RepID=UPI00210E1434|nr:zf-TFIIB domain-containing protein [Haloarchaeobius salinus]